jgi:hypothetical protein
MLHAMLQRRARRPSSVVVVVFVLMPPKPTHTTRVDQLTPPTRSATITRDMHFVSMLALSRAISDNPPLLAFLYMPGLLSFLPP